MLDCVIINPNSSADIYGTLSVELAAIEPPIWARIIAGYLRNKGFRIKIIDMEAQAISAPDLQKIISDEQPQIIAIMAYGSQPSASTQSMVGVRAAAEIIGDNFETIIIGGHPSALPEKTLREEPVTYVCDGEGPRTIESFLRGDPLHSVPGLVWRNGDTIMKNPCAAPLDAASGEMEGDAWDLLPPLTSYRSHQWQCLDDLSERSPYASIYTSFNCPFACSFCCISAPFHNNKFKTRDPIKVVDEIEMLYRDHNVKTFKIADEMFVIGKNYLLICEEIIRRGMGDFINIWAYARVDTIKPESLKIMCAAGIRWLALGIESGSKHVRDGSDKALKENDIVGIVRSIQAADINVIGNFIVGLPDDTIATMRETLALAISLNCEWMNLYSAMCYPGSKLYEDALASGRVLPEGWSTYSQHSYDCTPLGNETLTPAQVLRFRDDAFQAYFTGKRYQSKIYEKFGPAALNHVRDMATYKLPRQILGDPRR